jgi:hypothetical protein
MNKEQLIGHQYTKYMAGLSVSSCLNQEKHGNTGYHHHIIILISSMVNDGQ